MGTPGAPWRVKTRPCPFYQQGRCLFEQSCNFVHDISAPIAPSSSPNRLPELLDALRDVLDPPDPVSLVPEHGVSPHIPGEGWTLVNDTSVTKDDLLSPVSLPDLQLSRLSSIKNDSFDSGYGSEFSSPQPLPSTLVLVSSPFGSSSSRMSGSRLFSRSPFSPVQASPTNTRDHSPDLDSPSTVRHSISLEQEDEDDDTQYATAQWDVSGSSTCLDDPPEPGSRFSSSSDDVCNDTSFLELPQPGSRFSSSTLALTEDGDSDSDPDSVEEDSTAQLAYLASPILSQTLPTENDTISTLYDVYLHSPLQRTLSSDSEVRGRTRTPVFTPPPKFDPRQSSTPSLTSRSESRGNFPPSVFSDSSDSPPLRPLSSMSNGGKVSFGFRTNVPTSASPVTNSPEPIPSRPASSLSNGGKVPFGFRSDSQNSRRSLGTVSASALETSFSGGPPKPPRKRRVSRSVAPPSMSASRASFFQRSTPSPPPTVKGLKHLRLSKVVDPPPSAFAFSDLETTKPNVSPHASTSHSASPSISVPSLVCVAPKFFYHADKAMIKRSASIPPYTHTTLDNDTIRPRHDIDGPLRSAPISTQQSTIDADDRDNEGRDEDDPNYTIRRRIAPAAIHIPPTHARDTSRAASALGFTHPATPRPTLLFAIASDDPDAVRRVLEAGEAQATDSAGPAGQSALQFTLSNTQLSTRLEIARVLLAFGAKAEEEELTDPAIKYFVQRAGQDHARRSSALIHRSFFRPLTRVVYELVGQDRALEQLFRVLSMHSRQLSVLPVVVLLCGPSGHGKSFLARRFGTLLDVPTHTVNMTSLRCAHDLWRAYSMSPCEEPSACTLAEFLINNEGKRCVVVLDEIEKVDEKTLWSLLMPWESGRCSLEANSRHIDVRNVIWLGTSNVGHEVISEHHDSRALPDELMSREEYVELMRLVRVPVSNHMGPSILSRVTTVLPFVPFTSSEQAVICAEAFHALGGEEVARLPADRVDLLVRAALLNYVPAEGARSLYRAVSNQLLDL
ncbi:hypothetical protein GGX14DRAFT_587860 [Mycena pura]|uniref:C3H1-type domain-containing protein n=1 Tax=Mycena pura TaxID=153505 RepID=A0AAD6XZI1_9AGAR|nr:hypothetical protein GGX14DRAFT_587860 [Mycena pura]